MARIVHSDRIEVFAFLDTGLHQALAEAATLLQDRKIQDAVDTKLARLEYRDGTFYVVLPYATDEEDLDDAVGVHYEREV